MSILIRGMDMPKGNSTINVLIYADGTVYTGHVNDSQYSAVSVPTPHGRLGDLDELMTEFMDSDLDHLQRDDWKEVIQIIEDAPIVIEAEGSECCCSCTHNKRTFDKDHHCTCACELDGHRIGYVANFESVCEEWEGSET